MNILFVDDTEQMNKQFIGVGGLIINGEKLTSLNKLFSLAKSEHGIPSEQEIKWSPSRNSWIWNNLIGEKRISAYSTILDLLRICDAKIIVALVKRNMPKQRIFDAKWRCIEFVTERYQFFLQDCDDDNGIIIADFPSNNKEDKILLEHYYELLLNGTSYVKPENIVMNLLTTQSHLNPALQLADLIVGITTGMCTSRRNYAQPYWEIIKSHLHCNRYGEIIGCGLKIFPNELIQEVVPVLFPQEVEDSGEDDFDSYLRYKEFIEDQRYLYSQVLSKEELDLHFPLP